jgi:hypothetical protein
MSSDRLTELQRQRALVQEQLAWFDREIARETGQGAPTAASPSSAERPADTAPVAETPIIDREAEKILERYRHAGHPVKDEVKRGCLLYFFAAFALLALGLTAFWFLRR